MKKYISMFILAIILFGLYFFRITTSYRMPPMYNYDADFGRDLMVMQQINQGKLTLLGPQFNFSGLRLAPYHFYFFAPFLKISNNYHAVVYANAVFFIIGFLILFFYLFKKIGYGKTFLSILWLGTTPYIILSSRSPGNAFSYLILLTLYLFYLFFQEKFNYKKSCILGFLAGIMINYHPISTPVVFFSFLGSLLISNNNKVKQKIIQFSIFLICLILSFSPFLLFEIKHHFVIFKSVFTGEKNVFFSNLNILPINTVSLTFIWTGIIGLFILLSFVFIKVFSKKYLVWYLICFVSLLLLILYGQPVPHYLFPTILLIQIVLIFFIVKLKYSYYLLLFLLLSNLFFFPKNLFSRARNLEEIEQNLRKMIVKQQLPKKNLNIYLVNETFLSVVGYEYRYLLTKYGFQIDDEFSYKNSNFLLLISEKEKIDWQKLSSWEILEFGKKKLIKQFCQKEDCFYLFEKFSRYEVKD